MGVRVAVTQRMRLSVAPEAIGDVHARLQVGAWWNTPDLVLIDGGVCDLLQTMLRRMPPDDRHRLLVQRLNDQLQMVCARSLSLQRGGTNPCVAA